MDDAKDAVDALVVLASTSLEWNQPDIDGSPQFWIAETPHAYYRLCDWEMCIGKPGETWWLTVFERVPPRSRSARKTTSQERRKLRRAGVLPPRTEPERIYTVPFATEEQAKRLASQHAGTQDWDALERLHREMPFYWEEYGEAAYKALLKNSTQYTIEPDGDKWQPSFQAEEGVRYASFHARKNFIEGPLYPSLAEAKAAREKHHATGRWE